MTQADGGGSACRRPRACYSALSSQSQPVLFMFTAPSAEIIVML